MLKNNEPERLGVLKELNILDTRDNESFDRITRLASRLFGVPIALVTLIDEDRQWFKSRVGTEIRETPRNLSFCNYTIKSEELMVVPDMAQDARFQNNPLVSSEDIRFYAGAPLITESGYGLGSICIIDNKPRELSEDDRKILKDLSAMVMEQINLRHAVRHIDTFSGLPNRNQLFGDLNDMAQDGQAAYFLAVIDLVSAGRMEQILRTIGSIHGDALIRESTRLVGEALGRDQILYYLDTVRYVGIFPDTYAERLQELADNLSACFSTSISCSGVPVDIDLALGIARFEPGGIDAPDLVRSAVAAALDAREMQKTWSMYNPETDKAHRRSFALLTDMRQALEQPGQFRLVYQPRLDMRTGRCIGAEALMRWTHPELGPLSPGEFIPLAEQTALTRPVTEWVVKQALDQAAKWQQKNLDVCISINVSAHNLEETDFADRLEQEMRVRSLPAHSIEVEFTESALMRNASGILDQLNKIKSLGVEIAIDDFGTGYSNHAYVQKIPAKTIKIDQSLVRDLASNKRDQTIVQSIIAMMHKLNYRVVAEGIETQEVYDLLKSWNCDEAQGYLIAKPMEVNDFEAYMAAAKNGRASKAV